MAIKDEALARDCCFIFDSLQKALAAPEGLVAADSGQEGYITIMSVANQSICFS